MDGGLITTGLGGAGRLCGRVRDLQCTEEDFFVVGLLLQSCSGGFLTQTGRQGPVPD